MYTFNPFSKPNYMSMFISGKGERGKGKGKKGRQSSTCLISRILVYCSVLDANVNVTSQREEKKKRGIFEKFSYSDFNILQ